MLALFVKVPTMYSASTNDPHFFPEDSKYSADHGLLVHFPHFSAGALVHPAKTGRRKEMPFCRDTRGPK